MADREKVINDLIDFVADLSPFAGNHADWEKVNNAVKYLKAQEPVCTEYDRSIVLFSCRECKSVLHFGQRYCSMCGRKVKWDG